VVRAVAVGLLAASTPFLHYASFGGSAPPHADHEPHYGGQLGMIGDQHIEVVRRRGRVEVFVSDARRRPLHPLHGWAVFDRGQARPLAWTDHRLAGDDVVGARAIEAIVVLEDGTRLALEFDYSNADGTNG